MTVAVAGCVAQAEGEEIIRRAPVVDLVVGPQSYHRLPDLLARANATARSSTPNFRSRTSSISCPPPSARDDARARRDGVRHRAGRLRQVLHLLRRALHARRGSLAPGRQRSSPKSQHLADAGVREITLIGQNVNAYHGEGPDGRAWTLGRLLHRVAEIPGIARLRYTTSHPRDVDDDLIAAHRDLPQLDAAAASAGAVRLRPHPRRDEPPPHPRRLSARDRAAARCAARSRAHLGFHRRLPGRDRGGFPRHAAPRRRGRLFGRVLVQVFAAPRHARRRRWTIRSPKT